MSFNGTSVGLDVHALSVVAHAVNEQTGRVERARLCPDHGEILDWLHRLRGPVRVAYEAGPTGFGLARALADAQIDCTVAAPSKLIRPPGDRVKTDARDAAHLTRLLRLARGFDAGASSALEAAVASRPGVFGRASMERRARNLASPKTIRRSVHHGSLRPPL